MKPGKFALPALALVVLTLLAYSNSFGSGFVLDNRGLLLHDPRLRAASAANIGLILDHTYWWPNGESGLYRPFSTLSYLFNYSVLGNREQPAGYHWINFLLHAGNVLLIYALARRLLGRFWPALFIAALWAVHPVLTESVTNIVGRSDLLAAGSVIAALLLYLNSVEAQAWRRVAWLAGIAGVTAIGVFSKESAVIIPGVIVLYELTFRRRWGRAQVLGLFASLVPVAFMLYKRSHVLAGTLPMEIPFTDNPIAWADFQIGHLTALKVITRYFALIAWPATLSADYSWSQIPLFQGTLVDWVCCIGALAIIPATVFLYRWNRAAFFFFCLGFAWLAPASNLLFPTGTIMAERLVYLSAVGFIACIVLAVFAIAERAGSAKYALALFSLLTAGLAVRTWMRNNDWKDDMSMALASVRTSPHSFKTHDLLANVLFASDPSHGNIDRVIDESEKSRAILDLLPDDRKPADPYLFAANCYMLRRDYRKAIPVWRTYLAVEKDAGPRPNAWLSLSTAWLEAGDAKHAAAAAEQARVLDPMNPRLYRQIAVVAAHAGRLDDAAVALIEGAFLTSDKTLRQALVELYRQELGPRSCALITGPNGPVINPRCLIVHSHACAASAYVVATLAKGEQRELAQTRKRMFIDRFGCASEPLEAALP